MDPVPYSQYGNISLDPDLNQCYGAATFLGSGSGSPRSRSRLRLRPNWQKRRLQATSAPCTNNFHLELIKSESVMQVFFGSHLPLLIAFKSCFVTSTWLSFLLAKKMQLEPP